MNKDLRITFMMINDTYVGVCVCDAHYPFVGSAGAESFRDCIYKYLEMCGFKGIKQYLMAMPGYYGKEKEVVGKPMQLSNADYVRFEYDDDDDDDTYKNQPIFFGFMYLNSEIHSDRLLSYVNAYARVNMSKCEFDGLELAIIPTLHEVRRFFINGLVKDSDLWFCEDWKENT